MKGWNRAFDDPIPLSAGVELVTLRQAADHIMKLPKATRDRGEWQLAGKILIAAAEGRDFVLHARIAFLKAMKVDSPVPKRRVKTAKKYRVVR